MKTLDDKNQLIMSWRGKATLALEQRDAYDAWRRSLHLRTRIGVWGTFVASVLIFVSFTQNLHGLYGALRPVVTLVAMYGMYHLVYKTHPKPPEMGEWYKYEAARNIIAEALNYHTRIIETMDHHRLKTLVQAKIRAMRPKEHHIQHGQSELIIQGDDDVYYARLVAAAQEFNIHTHTPTSCRRTR